MKRKIFAAAVIVICLSTLAYGSLAYFTADDTARNVITAGSLDISIEEWQQEGDDLLPYPTNEPIAVMPATKVSKIVTVRNHDAQSFIRARLDVTVRDADGQIMELPPEALSSVITLAVNTEDWTQKDGWWYYGSPVDSKTATQPLMTEVRFDGPSMTNEYQNCTVEINVTAQAVQTANNRSTALEALGWPEE